MQIRIVKKTRNKTLSFQLKSLPLNEDLNNSYPSVTLMFHHLSHLFQWIRDKLLFSSRSSTILKEIIARGLLIHTQKWTKPNSKETQVRVKQLSLINKLCLSSLRVKKKNSYISNFWRDKGLIRRCVGRFGCLHPAHEWQCIIQSQQE